MNIAKQYVENRMATLPSNKEKDFFSYALNIPQKIMERRANLPLKIKEIQDELLLNNIVPYQVKKEFNINNIKSQNQFAESMSYTFGIVDGNLLFLNYSLESIELEIESDVATINGVDTKLVHKVFLVDNTTYVPLRFVSESFGLDVKWDNTAKAVLLE